MNRRGPQINLYLASHLKFLWLNKFTISNKFSVSPAGPKSATDWMVWVEWVLVWRRRSEGWGRSRSHPRIRSWILGRSRSQCQGVVGGDSLGLGPSSHTRTLKLWLRLRRGVIKCQTLLRILTRVERSINHSWKDKNFRPLSLACIFCFLRWNTFANWKAETKEGKSKILNNI